MLALPGSAYLYQGEELGLHEVADIPGDRREDPVFRRSGGAEKGRDGCRVPLPWTADGPSFGFSAGVAHLPQPAWFGPLSVQAQEHDSASTLALYRQLKMGTFALPATDDASQTKCRVNLDLAVWLPRSQAPAQRTAAIQFLDYLMQPSVVNAYNQANLAFSPLKNAPPQKSPLVSGLQPYVSSGRFYQGPGTYVPLTIPIGNFIQEMMLTGNVSGFTASMDSAFKRLAIRTSA